MDNVNDFNDYQRGFGTDLAPNWRDLAAKDSKPVPAVFTTESSPNLGSAKIPVDRYTDPDFHRLEVEKIWKRVWQVTCREEEIPNVGDHFVYNVAGLSFVVVRTAATTFKAYWNVCLHRCRRLVDESGCGAKNFKCNYHAWTWNIDGSLAFLPGRWDFPDVDPKKFGLREVQIDTWGGFIFINPDLNAGPLSEHLGSMPSHFAKWPLQDRYTLWHARKTINANWKVAMEAFLEGYHLIQTHPQALPSVGEHAAQYDVFEEENAYFARSITPTGVPSNHHPEGTAISAIADVWALLNAFRQDEPDPLPSHIKDRASIAEWRREDLKKLTNADYSTLSDAEILDAIMYWLFPSFCPWYGEGLPLSFVFRPNSDSVDTCYFDIWMLIHKPDAGGAPAAPKILELGPDDLLAPHFGGIGHIIDQDNENMPFVQIGCNTWPGDPEGATLARYQELRVRFFHQVLMKVLGRP